MNLKQEVEKTQKSAEAGCLKLLSLPNFFFFYSVCGVQSDFLSPFPHSGDVKILEVRQGGHKYSSQQS